MSLLRRQGLLDFFASNLLGVRNNAAFSQLKCLGLVCESSAMLKTSLIKYCSRMLSIEKE